MEQPTVLVDNCVLSEGYSDPAQWKRIDNQVGQFKLGNSLLIYQVKDLTPDERRVMVAIQAISNFSELGHITLYTYDELRWEMWRGRHSMKNNLTPLAAFQHTPISEVHPPVVRTKFFQTPNWTQGAEVDKFIGWLLEVDIVKLCDHMTRDHSYTDYERLCASRLGDFRQLCTESVFGRKKARDAFHYWAAECSGIDYFLTVDWKFINSYTNAQKHKKLLTKCKVVSPEELVQVLDIHCSPMAIPANGKMYMYNGHEFKK